MTTIVITDVSATCKIISLKPWLTFSLAKYRDFEVQSPERFTINPTETDLQWYNNGWQASHNYLALAFPGDGPQAPLTNGHLHRLAFGYASTYTKNNYADANLTHWSLVPVIAVSSNQLNNPEALQQESFRLDGHLIHEHRFQGNLSLFGGLCLGAMSGEYKTLPAIGINYRIPKLEITLAYPQTQFHYTLNSKVRFHSQWSLSGNQWSVLDHDLENRNKFNLSAQSIKLGITAVVFKAGYVELSWLYLYNQTMSYQARNNTRISADTDNTSGWIIHYTREFKKRDHENAL